jgi:hypothetical protein
MVYVKNRIYLPSQMVALRHAWRRLLAPGCLAGNAVGGKFLRVTGFAADGRIYFLSDESVTYGRPMPGLKFQVLARRNSVDEKRFQASHGLFSGGRLFIRTER